MKTLVIVDIQPAYADRWPKVKETMEYINNHKGNIVLFVNEELTDDSMDEIKEWWISNGLNQDIIDTSIIYDKGYGSLRDWMDEGLCEDTIIETIQYMEKHNIYSSDELDFDNMELPAISYVLLPELVEEGVKSNAGTIYANFIYKNTVDRITKDYILIGGSRHECLEEVRLYLKSQGKNEEIINEFIYDGDYGPVYNKRKEPNFNW